MNLTSLWLCAVVSAPLLSQEPLLRTISVTGQSELTVVADKATFTFSVLGLGESLRGAVEDAKAKTSAIVRTLNRAGLPQSAFQTEDFTSGENADKAFLSSSRDYRASLITIVTVDSLPLLERVVLALSEQAPQTISGISFRRSDIERQKRNAQVAAIRDALQRAERIAGELGVTIKEPLIVEAQSWTGPVYPSRAYRLSVQDVVVADEASAVADGAFFGAKSIIIRENARVVFQY